MDDSTDRVRLRRAGTIIGYVVLGAVGTALAGFALLPATDSVQTAVYDLFYLRVGPSDATEIAILAHFLSSGVVAISLPLLLGDYLSDRLDNLSALARGIAAMVVLIVLFVLVSFAGLAAFPTVLVLLVIGLVDVPLALRYYAGVQSGGLPTFVGGIPVIILLLFLAGFGIGWGWGYIVTAEEVPVSSVDGPVADFDDVPEIRDDLFVSGDCETNGDDRRTCHLQLRGYEHEVETIRFLDQHGARCPSQSSATRGGSFVAEYHETYYRITCSSHGD